MVLLSKHKDNMLTFFKQHWFEIIVLFIMSLLVFVNLDWRYFAADEAYNVTMGQYIIKNNGIPKVWDGTNIITTINGNDFNESLICINLNYGAYYITALMQLIFGKNTYLIRLPFAIMGVMSSIIWYAYFKKIFDNSVVRIFLLIYGLSIPIIIYTRNANYFAPSLFFIGLMYLYYKKGQVSNRILDYTYFILYSFIQFHINYMLFVFAIIPIFFDSIITGKCSKRFFISYAIVFMTTFPFFLWMRYSFQLIGSNYRNIAEMDLFTGYYRFIEQIWHISYYIAPIIPLAFIALIVKFCYINRKKKSLALDGLIEKKNNRNIRIYISLTFAILFNFIFLSFFTFEFETRYYLAIFPFLYITLALLIYEIHKKERIISYIIMFLILFSNVINMVPYNMTSLFDIDMNSKVTRTVISSPIPSTYIADGNESVDSLIYESYFGNYVFTYNLPIIDEINALTNFLNENAESGDTIATFGTEPWTNSIQYYTDLKLVNNLRIDYGSWANDSYYPNAERYYELVYCPDELVDWVLLPSVLYGNDELINVYLDESKYERILIEKTGGGMANDIWLYSFGPVQERSYVVLYRRIE